jgi:hypothetical protein
VTVDAEYQLTGNPSLVDVLVAVLVAVQERTVAQHGRPTRDCNVSRCVEVTRTEVVDGTSMEWYNRTTLPLRPSPRLTAALLAMTVMQEEVPALDLFDLTVLSPLGNSNLMFCTSFRWISAIFMINVSWLAATASLVNSIRSVSRPWLPVIETISTSTK